MLFTEKATRIQRCRGSASSEARPVWLSSSWPCDGIGAVYCGAIEDSGDRYAWIFVFFFFQAEDGIRDVAVTGVQTCALPISLLRQNSPVPIAGGEVLTRRQSFVPWLQGRALDIVQPDVTKVGGISEERKIAWMAEENGVRFIRPSTQFCALR